MFLQALAHIYKNTRCHDPENYYFKYQRTSSLFPLFRVPLYLHLLPSFLYYSQIPQRVWMETPVSKYVSDLGSNKNTSMSTNTKNDCARDGQQQITPLLSLLLWPASFRENYGNMNLIVSRQYSLSRGINISQSWYLPGQHKYRMKADTHPCLEWDSNPRSLCLRGFMH
jgi:hypothetical protein